jgi:hypothetical protein
MPRCTDVRCRVVFLPLYRLFLCALCEKELHAICGTRVQEEAGYQCVCYDCQNAVKMENDFLRSRGIPETSLLTMVQLCNVQRLEESSLRPPEHHEVQRLEESPPQDVPLDVDSTKEPTAFVDKPDADGGTINDLDGVDILNSIDVDGLINATVGNGRVEEGISPTSALTAVIQKRTQ